MRRVRYTGRATVLLAVLVVVSIAAMIGASAMYLGDAQASGAARALRAAQARAAAWSGVQAVMAQLSRQRDSLLRGGSATVAPDGSLGGEREGGGPRLVYRILPVGGALIQSEAGKVDVNTAGAEVLAKVPGLSAELAARIVAARDAERMSSLLDLLRVEGVTPELLEGAGSHTPAASAAANSVGGMTPLRGLAEYLTVFAFDPSVQAGIGAGDEVGKPRPRVEAKGSEPFAKYVSGRLRADVATALLDGLSHGTLPKTTADLCRMVSGLKPDQVGAVLDAVAVDDAPFAFGRLDLNTASAEALACLPGIDAQHAADLVARRSRLGDEARATPLWPVIEGLLTIDQFVAIADLVTARSLQWRVRVEGGWLPASGSPSDQRDRDTVALADAVAIEAVIDVAGTRPRVAYLRDITLLPAARALAEEARRQELSHPAERATAPSPPGLQPTGTRSEQTPSIVPPPASQADYRPPEPVRADQGRDGEPDTSIGGGAGAVRGRIGRWTPG